MVFLQLEAKVYPREPAPRPQNKDNGDKNGPKSYVGLWLSIENPEECTIAHLVWLINKEWTFMFPEAEKLEIKKLINDEHPMVLLHPKMSVAHYWVNKGKALADGCDQYGAVGVIQKPSTAPQRFLSVPPEFEHEVQAENARLSSRVSPIAEEPELPSSVAMSVEAEPAIAKPHTPFKTQALKRKADKSPDHPSVKEPRLGTDQAKSQTEHPSEPPSVQAKARTPELSDEDWSLCPDGHRMPTFASPRQNTRYSKPNPKGLGLDVRSSPKAWKTTRASDVSSPLPPFPSSALSSTKNSNPNRRVSFTDSAVPQSATKTPVTPSQVSVTPSSQTTVVWPPGTTKEKIEQIEKATRERAALLEEARAMAKDSQTDASIIETVRSIGSLDDEIHEVKNLNPKERRARSRYISRRKEELDALLGKFKEYKADLEKEKEKEKEKEDLMDIDPKKQAESESESGSESGSESDGSEPSDGENLPQAADEEMEDEPHEPTRETVGSTAVSDAKDGEASGGDSDGQEEEASDEDSDEEEEEEEASDKDSDEEADEDPTPRKKNSKNVMSLFDIEADDSPADDEQEDSDEEDSEDEEEEEDTEASDEAKAEEKVEESDNGDDESNSVSSSKSEKISNIADEAQDQVDSQATPSKKPEQNTSNPTLSQRAADLQADLEAPFSAQPSAAQAAKKDDSSSSSDSSSSDSELDPALGYGIPPKPTTSVFDPPKKSEMDRPLTLLERVALARKDEAARVAREQEAREQKARELASSQPKPDVPVSEPSVSEAESIDDMGDMLPNGTWGKIRRPRFNR